MRVPEQRLAYDDSILSVNRDDIAHLMIERVGFTDQQVTLIKVCTPRLSQGFSLENKKGAEFPPSSLRFKVLTVR